MFLDGVGSSPRVRGTVAVARAAAADMRFIPARAGNSSAGSVISSHSAVHPRTCGEQRRPRIDRDAIHGSSPRVRGTAKTADETEGAPRFIPARAGNSVSQVSYVDLSAVHPRACGEQGFCEPVVEIADGSSPRVRGTVSLDLLSLCLGRFIPARAGNRSFAPRAWRRRSVHPRACGEQCRAKP